MRSAARSGAVAAVGGAGVEVTIGVAVVLVSGAAELLGCVLCGSPVPVTASVSATSVFGESESPEIAAAVIATITTTNNTEAVALVICIQ